MPHPQDDLAAIRRLMEDSQAAAADDGRHLLLWGTITAAGLLGTYGAVAGTLPFDPKWLWGVLLAAGWAGSTWLGFRGARRARVSTLGRRLLALVWVACGVTATLIAAAGLLGGAVDVRALSGLMAVVVGGPYLPAAALTGERWLAAVAVAWWIAGAVMLFVPGLYTLPLLAAMALAFQAAPGAVLYRRWRRRAAAPEPA